MVNVCACVYLVIDWPRMVIISQIHSGIHKNNNINNFGIRKIFIIYDVYRTQKMMNVNKKKINNSGKYDQKKKIS